MFVAEQTGGPDKCTICPRVVARDELLTTWISAGRTWVIDLETAR